MFSAFLNCLLSSPLEVSDNFFDYFFLNCLLSSPQVTLEISFSTFGKDVYYTAHSIIENGYTTDELSKRANKAIKEAKV